MLKNKEREVFASFSSVSHQLLQRVLSPEDFSKFDKFEKKLVPPKQQERVKLRERELLEAVERILN